MFTYILWFIFVVNNETYSAPLSPHSSLKLCKTELTRIQKEMELAYPTDKTMKFACLLRQP